MDIKDQARLHGYPIIDYPVTTLDGYKLGLHRIPGPKGTSIINGIKTASSKEPVLIMHGIMESA
jgi:hypothetical protein